MAVTASSHQAYLMFNTAQGVQGLNYFSSALQRTRTRMAEFVGQAGYLGLALTRIATYTGIFTFFGLMAKSVKDNIELQQRFAEVSTLVESKNVEQAQSLEIVKQQILELNPALGSAIDMTKGLYEIMSAGINEPQEALKILVQSAKYAKAGLTDLGTSAATLTSIIKAYRLSADDARKSSDFMFASVMEGKYHAEDLNEALGRVLPTAAAMGVGVDEVGAALAVLSQRGLSAGESATALNRIMISFLKPMKGVEGLMHSVGLETGMTAFQSEGLLGVLQKLTVAAATHSNILAQIFTRERGLRGAFILTGKGAEEYAKMLDKVRGAAEGEGVVEEAHKKILETVAERWKALGARVQQAMAQTHQTMSGIKGLISVLDFLAPILVKVTRSIIPLVAVLGVMVISGKAVKLMLELLCTRFEALSIQYYTATQLGRFMTNSLRQQTEACDVSITRWQTFGGMIKFASMAAMAGIITYQLLKQALDAIVASLDRAIQKEVEYGNTMKRNRELMEYYSDVMKRATGENINFRIELDKLVASHAQERLLSFTKESERFTEVWKAMGRPIAKNMVDLKKEMEDIIDTISAGLPLSQKQYTWLLTLGRAWGYEAKSVAEATKMVEANAKANQLLQGEQRKIAALFVQLGENMGYVSDSWEKLANELSKDDLVRLAESVKNVMAMLKGTGTASDEFRKKIQDGGYEISIVTKAMEDLDAVLAVALKNKYGVDLARMTAEEYERMGEVLGKVKLTAQEATAKVTALMSRWQEELGKGDMGMAKFAKLMEDDVKQLMFNLQRIPEGARAFIIELNSYLEKNTIGESLKKQADTAAEWMEDSFTRLIGRIEVLDDKINQEEYKSATARAVTFLTIEKRKWADAMETYRKNYGLVEDVELKYLEFLGKAKEEERKVRLAGITDWMEAYAKAQQESISSSMAGAEARLAIAKKEYQEGINFFNQYFGKFPGLVEWLIKLWKYFWDNFIKNLEKSIRPLDVWSDRFRSIGRMVASLTSLFRDMFDNLGMEAPGFVEIFDAIAKGVTAISTALKSMDEIMVTAGGKLTTFTDKLAYTASVADLVVAVATTLVSIFADMFTEDEAEKLERYKKSLAEFGEVSDSVAKEWGELADKAGEVVATYTMLDKLMGDTGVSAENFTLYLQKMKEMLESLVTMGQGRGIIPDLDLTNTKIYFQLIESLGKSFQQMAEYLQKVGQEGDASFVALIKRIRELGIHIKEVDDYVYGWLERGVAGVGKMIAAVQKSEPELERAAGLLLSMFNAAIAQGMSMLDAITLIGEPLEALAAKYKELGLTGSEAIQMLLRIQKVKEENAGLFEAISGLNEAIQALGNTGFLTVEDFKAMQQSISGYFDRLKLAGLSSKEALAVIAPILANLEYYAKQYGFALDPATQSLIDQAKAAGVYQEKAKTLTEILEEGFGNICDKLDEIVNLFTGDNGLIDAVSDFKKSGPWDEFNNGAKQAVENLKRVQDNMPRGGAGDYEGAGYPGAQLGMAKVGDTQLIRVHKGESILPEDISSSLRSFFGGVAGPRFGGSKSENAEVTVEIDGMVLYKALVPILRKGMSKYGDVEMSGRGVF
jgi:TP901 family phage tail tape measure protein